MNQLGRYQIVRELGRGAMGVVFEARDLLIGRTVALKMIRLDSLGTPDEREWLQERLFREARSAGALSHPGIVVIYDLGVSEDLAYIAMEYVEGPTLEQILAKTHVLNRNEVLSVVRQTAEALDHAHGAGVVHRDVKPANIILRAGSTVKVTDFGIAKITTTQQITRTGMTMGTPSYMSPEQIRAMALDGRADQFSLAVVTFQILTGVKPFQGDSLPTLVHQIVYEDRPSARAVNQALPETVDQVLFRGLAKLPEDRYESCAKFAEALETALRESPSVAIAGSESVTSLKKQESDFTALFAEFIEANRLEVEKQERAARLQRTVEEVERLLALGDLRATGSVLNESKEQFGDEPAFLKVSERMEEARRQAERRRRIDEALQQAQEQLQTKDFAEAIRILDKAGAEYGNPAPVAELRARVLEEQASDTRDRERREYAADLAETLVRAKELMALPLPAEAVTFLKSTSGRFGKESDFTSLFGRAIEAKRLAEARAAKLNASVANAADLLAIGDWQTAQMVLEDAQHHFPSEPALAPLLIRLKQMRQTALQDPSDASSPGLPAPEIAGARPDAPPWAEPPPALIKKRMTISKELLAGASAVAAVVLALLLVKVFVSSSQHASAPQATRTAPTKLATRPEVAASIPLRITQFYSSPPNPVKGQKFLVCYGVENATSVHIDPPVGRLWPALSRCLQVTQSRTVTYTLTAVRGSENVSKSLAVQIGPPPVRILELSIDKRKIAPGDQVTVCYKVKNATLILLSPGTQWGPHTQETGCVADHPNQTTTYTLTAHDTGGGVDTEHVTATVATIEKAHMPGTPKTGAEQAKPKEERVVRSGNLAPGGETSIKGTTSNGSVTETPPATPQRVRVGGQVQAANLIKKVSPPYPELAKKGRISGQVRFTAIIGTDGTVQHLELVSGHPLLVDAARTAVAQWVYKPTLLNNEPVEVITQIDVNFTLSN